MNKKIYKKINPSLALKCKKKKETFILFLSCPFSKDKRPCNSSRPTGWEPLYLTASDF